jgi:DNA-binding response OmpR family regulator
MVKILVNDDEEAIRFTFERFLKTQRHVVDTAESCSEAGTRMNETSFDPILADIIPGEGTGIDLLCEIRLFFWVGRQTHRENGHKTSGLAW